MEFEDILQILQQTEKLLSNSEYEISSTHIMQLVKGSKCSAYDCEFVALAQHLNVPLITIDKNILREFPDRASARPQTRIFLQDQGVPNF